MKRLLISGCLTSLLAVTALLSASAGGSARPRAASDCAEPAVAVPRDPANPLALPVAPSTNDPLQGAHLFVDGPRHGDAAGAVAHIIGRNPDSYSDSYSWTAFQSRNAGAIAGNHHAAEIAKIADQEETQNMSSFAGGGGRGAIYAQTQKILCGNLAADPTPATVPVFTTFMIYPNGNECPSVGQERGWQSTFHRDVNEMAQGIGRRRAVILEEIDSIAVSGCLHGQALSIRLSDLRYESKVFGALPHAVVYAEAGYSDDLGAGTTAKRLWQSGVSQVRGFFTNDTHLAWSIDEIRWAQNVSDILYSLSHHRYRAHFIVNTSQNGHGPKLNPHPVSQGIEDLCNPPGRGLGRKPTAVTNIPLLDAFLWTGVPGRSHGSNCPNGPWKPGGIFDPRYALELAQGANQKLGPGYPSQPY